MEVVGQLYPYRQPSDSAGGYSTTCGPDPQTPQQIPVAKVSLPSLPIPSVLIVRSAPTEQKESLRLMDLCDNLTKRLSDRTLILEQPDHEDIKWPAYHLLPIYVLLTRNDSKLTRVKEQLAGWSKYNYPRSLSKTRSP